MWHFHIFLLQIEIQPIPQINVVVGVKWTKEGGYEFGVDIWCFHVYMQSKGFTFEHLN